MGEQRAACDESRAYFFNNIHLNSAPFVREISAPLHKLSVEDTLGSWKLQKSGKPRGDILMNKGLLPRKQRTLDDREVRVTGLQRPAYLTGHFRMGESQASRRPCLKSHRGKSNY